MQKILGFMFDGAASESGSVDLVVIDVLDEIFLFCGDHISADEIAATIRRVLVRSEHQFILNFVVQYGQGDIYRLFKLFK